MCFSFCFVFVLIYSRFYTKAFSSAWRPFCSAGLLVTNSLNFVFWKMFFFFLFFKDIFTWHRSKWQIFSCGTLELPFHCHQASIVSANNFVNIVTFVLLHVMDIFLLAVFSFFLLITGFRKINYSVSWYVFFFCLLNFDELWFHSFHQIWTIFYHFICTFFSALPALCWDSCSTRHWVPVHF